MMDSEGEAMLTELETMLKETALVRANWERILEALGRAWIKRCEEQVTKGERDFCFVWDAKVDGLKGSGVFCRRNMVRQRFGDEMEAGMQELIDQADHATQVVGILIFGERGYGFIVQKVVDLEWTGPQRLN